MIGKPVSKSKVAVNKCVLKETLKVLQINI